MTVYKAVASGFTPGSTTQFCYRPATPATHPTLVTGGRLVYDVYYEGQDAHLTLDVSPATTNSWQRDNLTFLDQDGLSNHPSTAVPAAVGAWHTRSFVWTPSVVGGSVTLINLSFEAPHVVSAPATAYFRNARIEDASGTVVLDLLADPSLFSATDQYGTGGMGAQAALVEVADPVPPAAPTAAFTVTSDDLIASVDATASTGDITDYAWNWGDTDLGPSEYMINSATYDTPGTYTVTLTVTGPGGTDSVGHDVTVTAPGYTLVLGDADTVVESTSPGPLRVVVPPNSAVAFPVGTVVGVRQYSAGQLVVEAGAGVTIRSAGGAFRLAEQYAEASLMSRVVDEWVLVGHLVV